MLDSSPSSMMVCLNKMEIPPRLVFYCSASLLCNTFTAHTSLHSIIEPKTSKRPDSRQKVHQQKERLPPMRNAWKQLSATLVRLKTIRFDEKIDGVSSTELKKLCWRSRSIDCVNWEEPANEPKKIVSWERRDFESNRIADETWSAVAEIGISRFGIFVNSRSLILIKETDSMSTKHWSLLGLIGFLMLTVGCSTFYSF